MNAQYALSGGGVEAYDIDALYDAIKEYLDANMIRYAHKPGRLVGGRNVGPSDGGFVGNRFC